ncbi:MAG: alpha/beta fold hydrolase [Bacteroidia bacterium]
MEQTINGVPYVRTPENRFENIHDFNYESKYVEFEGLCMHYIHQNEGAKHIIVFVHGVPTWSYMWRKYIDHFSQIGFQVVAPDLIGFGKSDKPTDVNYFSYTKASNQLERLLFDYLGLQDVNLVVHDWGGLLGLRLLAKRDKRFASLVAINTGFLGGVGFDLLPLIWQFFMLFFKPSSKAILKFSLAKETYTRVASAYLAPFPSGEYETAIKTFPLLIPTLVNRHERKLNQTFWKQIKQFDRPFLTIFSKNDWLTRGADKLLWNNIVGAKNYKSIRISKAGHFLPEEKASEVIEIINTFYVNTMNLK